MSDDTLDDVLEALETVLANTSAPVATAPEVADALPYDRERRRVLEDLRTLERAGETASKTVGANARVWWPTDPRPDSRITPPARTHARTPENTPTDAHAADSADESDRATVRALANAADVPGRTRALEDQRREAVRAALAYIRDNGDAYRRDLAADVYPDHAAGYDSADSWWKNALQPALSDVADSSDSLEKAGSRSPWIWQKS